MVAKKNRGPRQGEVERFVLKKGQRCPRVSSLGRYKDSRGVIKRPKPEKGGCSRVEIFGTGYRLGNLVCRAFNGRAPSKKHTVGHISGARSGDAARNLEWALMRGQVL